MTANELAEQLEAFGASVLAGESPFAKHAEKLRQQEAEINRLEKDLYMLTRHYNQLGDDK